MAKGAVGYVRVSSDEQARGGVSLDAQAEKIRAYCRLHDLDLGEIYTDAGVSGKTTTRPALDRAMEQVAKRRVSHFIVTKLDRLSRGGPLDVFGLLAVFEKHKTSFVAIMDGVDTSTAMGEFLATIRAGADRLERRQISERTKEAAKHMLCNGRKCSSTAPYGFRYDGKAVLPDPDEQIVLTRILELSEGGASTREIAEMLRADGVTIRGTPPDHRKIHRFLNRDW